MNFGVNLKRNLSVIGLKLKKHSPEILVVAGCAGAATAAVMACKATRKLDDVIMDHEDAVVDIQGEFVDDMGELDTNDKAYKKELAKEYLRYGKDIVKLYAPSAILGLSSLGMILTSNGIMKRRYAGLAAGYTTLDNMFKKYRQNVIDTFGEDIDRDMRYGIKHETIEETVVDEKTGKEKKTKRVIDVTDDSFGGCSDFARIYEKGCHGYDADINYTKDFILGVQKWANAKLRTQGFLFLNDVYSALGFDDDTLASHYAGWVYDPECPIGDNKVIIFTQVLETYDDNKNLVKKLLLDFNIDGNILESEALKLYMK